MSPIEALLDQLRCSVGGLWSIEDGICDGSGMIAQGPGEDKVYVRPGCPRWPAVQLDAGDGELLELTLEMKI